MFLPTILLADNDPDFLSICSEFLESEGYQIFRASNIEEVRVILESNHVHLAIFDLRLTDDENEKDRSGLILAKELTRSIPKIILTKFPSHEDVREALKIGRETLPPAIDFVDKRNGLNALLESIHQAFADYLKINWKLKIDWNMHESFGLVKLIEYELKKENIIGRAEEFQDLLYRLFYDKENIRLDRILWQTKHRIAIVIFSFKDGHKPEAMIMVCGLKNILSEEKNRFETFAPKISSKTSTILAKSAETVHFAANCYILSNNDLEQLKTLHELFQTGSEKVFNSVITNLYQDILKNWHQEKKIHLKDRSIQSLYQERLHITIDDLINDRINKRLEVIEHQAVTKGLAIKRIDDKLSFVYNGKTSTFTNPFLFMGQQVNMTGLVIYTSGLLNGENIIVNDFGDAWLTDFSDSGQAPLLWNYVNLESAIRFDWIETGNPIHRYEIEHCLINTEFFKPDIRDLDNLIKRPIRAIQGIRKLAATHVGRDIPAYNQGIFWQGIKRFLDFNPENPLRSMDLSRFIHILFSISMIANLLNKSIEKNNDSKNNLELRIDASTYMVYIGKQGMRLAPRPFKVLMYLYENSNKVCTTEELRKNVVGENYGPTYIHTLIGRIREVIEFEPDRPQYLLSEPNVGYKLRLRPK